MAKGGNGTRGNNPTGSAAGRTSGALSTYRKEVQLRDGRTRRYLDQDSIVRDANSGKLNVTDRVFDDIYAQEGYNNLEYKVYKAYINQNYGTMRESGSIERVKLSRDWDLSIQTESDYASESTVHAKFLVFNERTRERRNFSSAVELRRFINSLS